MHVHNSVALLFFPDHIGSFDIKFLKYIRRITSRHFRLLDFNSEAQVRHGNIMAIYLRVDQVRTRLVKK